MGSIGVSTQYEDMGFGKVRNPMPQVSNSVVLEALGKLPSRVRLNEMGTVKEVPIKSLYSPQDYLYSDKLNYMRDTNFGIAGTVDSDNEATVLHYNGQYILIDGTHRTIMELEKKKKTIRVRVIEVK